MSLSGVLKTQMMRVYDVRPSTAEKMMDITEIVSNIAKAEYRRGKADAQQWIPCSERLPATNKDVLIQFYSNQAVGYVYDDKWYINSGGDWSTDVFPGDEQPLAWMPLPEPYKEREKNE